MTDGQMMALGIIVAIVLIKWVLPTGSGNTSKLQRILTAAWNSPTSDPFSNSSSPFVPVTVGTGGDALTFVVGGVQHTVAGTFNGPTGSDNHFVFTPTNSRIPQLNWPSTPFADQNGNSGFVQNPSSQASASWVQSALAALGQTVGV